MNEVDRIRDQIERAFDGDPWCGPSLMEVLEGIDASLAAIRVLGVSHSIWEIVLHVSGWQGAVADRIAGKPVAMPEAGGWPEAAGRDAEAWEAAKRGLVDSHRRLLIALDGLSESDLDHRVGDSRNQAMGTGMTAFANLHGIAQHAMYHAGQIAILKKLASR